MWSKVKNPFKITRDSENDPRVNIGLQSVNTHANVTCDRYISICHFMKNSCRSRRREIAMSTETAAAFSTSLTFDFWGVLWGACIPCSMYACAQESHILTQITSDRPLCVAYKWECAECHPPLTRVYLRALFPSLKMQMNWSLPLSSN